MSGGGKDKAGKKLLRAKLWGAAEKYYDQALALHPDKVLFLERAAFLKRKMGKYVDSEMIFTGLASNYPGVPRFAFHLAKILVEGGKEREAIDMLERALLYAPGSVRLLTELGHIYIDSGDWDKGKECFRAVLRKRRNVSLLVEFFVMCHEHNDIDAIAAMKCDAYIKEYFLKHYFMNEEIKRELFGDIPHFSDEYFASTRTAPGLQLIKRSVRVNDMKSKYVNVFDGARRTIGVPETYDKTVYLLGASYIFGAFCEDSHTIPSFLQSLCNSSPGEKIRVVNLGVHAMENRNAFLNLMGAGLRKGDMAIYFPYFPVFGSGSFISNDFERDFQHYSAMRDFCALKQASFHIALLPSILRIENPSARERSLQAMELRGRNAFKTIRKSHEKYDKYRELMREGGFQFIPLESVVNRPHATGDEGEIFPDMIHFNHRANKEIAREAHIHLMRSVYGSDIGVDHEKLECLANEAKQYLKEVTIDNYAAQRDIMDWLRTVKNPRFDGYARIGAIVMNCNPFTLGHRHLVESAAAMVDGLYIFVVQEDKSFFPFADRLSLVREGIKDIGGAIHIVPSGRFIISSFVFPGYFAKAQAVTPADSTVDVAIFGSIIAPGLGITHRFVGEEPNCITTNEYNDTMNFLLPALGVEMHIIPRKTDLGEAISATTVRRCMQSNDFETIKRLVPASTYEYLKTMSAGK